VFVFLALVIAFVAAQQQLAYSREYVIRDRAMIGDRPAMEVIAAVFAWIANVIGLIVLVWYTTLVFGFRKRLKNLIARCQAQAGG
jgi:hypothetical protein